MKLKELKSVDELLSIERVKMVCLYFVCGILWPIAPVKNPLVDEKIFSLIDDFDAFNKHPWGTITFKGAVFDLKCDLKKKEVSLREKVVNGKRLNSGTHDMVGFIYPLQILAYECVSGIGERFAKQKEGDNTSLPRMCQWISNKWPKKGSPRYIDILNASKSGEKIIRSILLPTDQESTSPYIRNIFIEDSTDSDLSFINSLLLEGKSVYCIRNPALCESKETLQSKEKDKKSKFCPKIKSTRSYKIYPAKKAPEKQSHEAERDDTLGESNIIRQVTALQEHIDKNFVELKNMISNLDSKLERVIQVVDISSSPKRRSNEPTTVSARSKRKKTHEYEPVTPFFNQGVVLGQEATVEPLTSPLTSLDYIVKETTFVDRDLNGGVSREQLLVNDEVTNELDVLFDPLHEPPSNERQRLGKHIIFYTRSKKKNVVVESQKNLISGCGVNEQYVATTEISFKHDDANVITVEYDAAMNDQALPKEITPSIAVKKYARRSKKSQFCRSPYVQLPETPALTALGYTGPYNGSFEPVQCVSIKKVLSTVTKEVNRLHDGFKACTYGSYGKSWFTNLLNPRHWLDESHIYECMYGLSVLQKTYPHLVKQDVAIMSPYFSQDICFAYRNARDDFSNSYWKKLFGYVDGYCRRWTSVPWANASSVLIPLNLPIHWVAVVVNVKDEIITIFDCNHGCYTDAEMIAYIDPVEYVVQHLLHYSKVKIPDMWTVARPKDFPQNMSSSDCGAWMLKTFEVELSQQSPYGLNDNIVNSYRKYLGTSVWYGEWIL
ncbi:uncharacterized protein [Henckelia pumila]|uniref:uncharacterized protein n=1 Tax=Henckelia pumila TaxID=405737 RepID=UPI003C6DF409